LAREIFLHDQASRIHEAHQKGLAEGEIKTKQAIAQAMLAKGIDVESIAEITGLSVDILLKIK
jgi:predicted transposase/invertase (TIGR01784 family)